MKKVIYLGVSTLFLLVFFASCKKDSQEPTTAEKIQHKWKVVSVEATPVNSGVTVVIASNPDEDYMEFGSDMKVYASISGESDTSDYSIVSDDLLLIDGEQAEITDLSQSSLGLKETEGTGTNEVTYTIKLIR